MVKKNLAEDCIFCGCAPCECDGVKKAAPKAKKKAAPIAAEPAAPGAPVEKSEDIFGDVPEQVTRFKAPKKQERDLSMENVLRILRPEVSKADQARIDKIVKRHYPQDVDRRVAEWRKDHGILG